MMRPLGRRTLIAGAALLGLPARAQPGPGGVVGGQPMPAVPGGGLVGPGGLPGPTLELDFQNGLGLDPRISFTRASSGTYFDVTGTMQTAASNVPRIGYDPVSHLIRGLLIEEARTNLLLNSATLATQSVTGLTATAYTLSFYGTGSVAMSGVFTGTLAGTGAFPTRVTQTFTPAAGALTVTVTGSVLDAQLEAGAFATSYVATTGAASTRAQDVATMPVGPWFSAVAGTIAVDGIPTVVTMAGINQEFVSVGTNSSNLIRFVITNGSAQPTVQTWVTTNMGGPTVANSLTNGVAFKGAFTYNAAALTASVVLNGGAIASATSTAVPAFSSLFIGGGRGGPPDSYFSRVRYWPRALSAGELQIVTT
jgi:hypothetical protein